METAIAEYSKTEAALAELRQQYGATVWVVDTPDRMAAAKKARGEIKKWRSDLEATRKAIKAPALQRCRDIDGEARRIAGELLALEKPVDDAIKEVEQAKKREEEKKRREEEERVAKARAEIERIRNVPVGLVGASADAIETAANALKELDLEWTAEFAGVAGKAQAEILVKLRDMYAAAKRQEEEQAQLAKEREELDQLRAEQAERDKVDRERRDAEERERRAKIEAEEREARERIAAEEALAREAREKADAEARALRAQQEEQARLERAKLEEERRRVEEQQRAERLAKQRRLDARSLLESFVEDYGDLSEFKTVTEAINVYLASVS